MLGGVQIQERVGTHSSLSMTLAVNARMIDGV
jgi:hypothetical protein